MTKDGDLGQDDGHNDMSSPDSSVLMGISLSSIDAESDAAVSGIKMEDDEDLDELGKGDNDDEVSVHQMLSVVNAGGNLIRANHATLQSLLSSPISASQVYGQPDGIQVITVPTTHEMMGLGGDMSDRLIHMVPTSGDLSGLGTKYIGLIAISNSNLLSNGKDIAGIPGLEMVQTSDASDLTASADNMAAILMPPPPAPPDLPPNCPQWAMRLKKCEKIGDSYRGYVENEIDLDLILTLHKQQTNSFWGTRQSPSPAKASTRLMWKSQYVPFDGIPFVNAGSRAVVMECQFGPRRKGTLGKRGAPANTSNEFKQTCPARIYIKKVRKFPSHAVNLAMDKKNIRLAMDKAFHELREQGLDTKGEERFYVQLPTEKAHDYHEEVSCVKGEVPASILEEVTQDQPQPQEKGKEARIHPAVLEKIRQLVASGETKLYSIRKQLRKFVVRDLFQGSGQVPERHDLTMFPTVNDLKNHIHQALKDIESGVLPFSAPLLNLEVVQGSDNSNSDIQEASSEEKPDLSSMWSGANIPSSSPMPETVTVTLTQNPEEDGHHIISRIETHLSDGTTQVSTTLTPETAQLLSRLHPGLFPAGSLLQFDSAHAQSSSSESLTSHTGVLGSAQDPSSMESPVSGLDASMGEGVHVIGGIDSTHLSSMVDMDGTHNIHEMMDSDTASSLLVNSDPSQPISGIHLDPNSSQNISGLIDSDSTNLASIVTSDSHSHITNLIIPGSSLSVLSAMDSTTLSEMVSSGAAQLSTVPGHPDTIALVTGDHNHHTIGLVSTDSSDGHINLVGDESCDQINSKLDDLDDHDDSHEKLTEDKITLHITSDQEIGMARLENKVSDL